MSSHRRDKKPRAGLTAPGQAGDQAADSPAGLERALHRLQHLYEISKLFASFETTEQTFDAALSAATNVCSVVSKLANSLLIS